MSVPHRLLAAAALTAVLVTTGCTAGEDATGSGAKKPASDADVVVVLKPGATDLNAMDLRDKLVALEGVEAVIYDQSVKRLRVDLADTAVPAQRNQVKEVAQADAAVQQVNTNGGDEPAASDPAPSSAAATS